MRKAPEEKKPRPGKAVPRTREQRLDEALRANLRRRKAAKSKPV